MSDLPAPKLVELIGFTGHRDRVVDERSLDMVRERHPNAVWVHGDAAQGFDAQIADYAQRHGIISLPIRPKRFTAAFLHARNREIVNAVAILYTCWDGRQTGGTYETRKYALSRGVTVRDLRPLEPSASASPE